MAIPSFFYSFTKKLLFMNKEDNYQVVEDAEQAVIEEVGRKMYYMLPSAQRAQLVQEKLPTKPLYCLAKVKEILNNARKQG